MSLLTNKVVVITGGNGLLGSVIVSEIIAQGGFCINVDIALKTNDDLSQVECDITDPYAVKKVVELITSKYPKVDGLINNAYPRTADWGKKFEDIAYTSWQKNVDIQLNTYFLFAQEFSKIMVANKFGVIINMASIYGVVGPDFGVYDNTNMTMPAAYAAIKGGLINLSRYMASYLGPHNIRVNTVSPGGIFDNQNPTFVKQYENKVPMRRMGNPDDIAPAVVFLLSDGAKYITGQNLIIDGGWTSI